MRTIALALASLIALASPLAAQQQQPAESPPTPDCRALQPDQCMKTCGCVFYLHAKEAPCRSVNDRVPRGNELFSTASTMAWVAKCPPKG
jgi:hypothetical protein